MLRHPPLPDVWQLNRVHLRGLAPADLSAGGLVALADRELDGVAHRRVTLDDAAAGERLWPELQAVGWRRERAVMMALDRAPARPVSDARVHELDEPALSALQRALLADDAGGPSGAGSLPARLALAQVALRAGTAWRAFGAGPIPGDGPVAGATVFLDPDAGGDRVAVIDQVGTLRRFREQGLATAVVAAAIAAARQWRADVIGLFADADDWPQVMYAGIGFAAVGRQVVLHRDLG